MIENGKKLIHSRMEEEERERGKTGKTVLMYNVFIFIEDS